MYFGTSGDLCCGEDGFHRCQIPAKHVEIAYWNMVDGKSWDLCSPTCPMTREQAAFIMANYKPEKARMRILLIDDLRNIEGATKIARTFDEGIKALKEEGPWDALWLDHDLGQPDGQDGTGIMNWLDENRQFMPGCIQCVSSNPVGRDRINKVSARIYSQMNDEKSL